MEKRTYRITFNGMLAACANSIYQIQICIGIAANGFGLGDVAVTECSIELQMFKIYTKCQ